ncbi:stressosome-associated protein Prli42 [Paenisporosarcina quisquiliarum]|uniref:Stressosome-associated protein Prli42 n=1 Tax=Paenisporosarcina quisquiliarum TaxID=365346 RepID=A0A9X3LK35_9BACL|nr:stressosome-associated protein Prli42 [Paenisporosarcina quisquiliarum]MCZ8537984.1 stressosome-associated protein Prli42 [Paenisporosarcina quisquiliarum]
MRNANFRKFIIYLMIIMMVLSSVLFGLSLFF